MTGPYGLKWNTRIFITTKSFIDTAITKATEFFKVGILPELKGRWFTESKVRPSKSEPTDCDKWCCCGLGEEGEIIANSMVSFGLLKTLMEIGFALSAYINTSNLYKFSYLFKYNSYLLT